MPKLYEYCGADFKTLVRHYADDIVAKWVDYFVLHRPVTPVRITRRLG